jgi:hypothetical protein
LNYSKLVLVLKKILYKEMAVGFSAGTGMATELHRLLSWSFHSTLLEKAAAPSPMATQAAVQATNSKPSRKLLLLKVLIPVALVLVIAIVGLYGCGGAGEQASRRRMLMASG